jgi:hypothetical protein
LVKRVGVQAPAVRMRVVQGRVVGWEEAVGVVYVRPVRMEVEGSVVMVVGVAERCSSTPRDWHSERRKVQSERGWTWAQSLGVPMVESVPPGWGVKHAGEPSAFSGSEGDWEPGAASARLVPEESQSSLLA